MSSYRKYYPTQGARVYATQRKSSKHAAELRMIDRVFAEIPRQTKVLDCPCGGGRLTAHLAQKGYTVTGADVSEEMVNLSRALMAKHGLNCTIEPGDLEKLSYADRSFDTVICFRLFHHFPEPGIRKLVISELCRASGRFVALSYFSPLSYTSVYRKVRAALGGKKPRKWATSLKEIEGYFAAHGFKLVKDFSQLPLVHTLHVALFERAKRAR
jgi:ubiquinone/menaquinone biosynthesis C-methylase UbiE